MSVKIRSTFLELLGTDGWIVETLISIFFNYSQ
jgi:hypothetical protein